MIRNRAKNPNARSENVSARIAPHIQADLDSYCDRTKQSRSKAVSSLIELGLEHIREQKTALIEDVYFYNVDTVDELKVSVEGKPPVTLPHNDVIKALIKGLSREFREEEGQRVYDVLRTKLGAFLKILQALDVDQKKIIDLVEILL